MLISVNDKGIVLFERARRRQTVGERGQVGIGPIQLVHLVLIGPVLRGQHLGDSIPSPGIKPGLLHMVMNIYMSNQLQRRSPRSKEAFS